MLLGCITALKRIHVATQAYPRDLWMCQIGICFSYGATDVQFCIFEKVQMTYVVVKVPLEPHYFPQIYRIILYYLQFISESF